MTRCALAAVVWGAVAPAPLTAQTIAETVPLVHLPASVRFAALNGAGAALVGHAGSVFTNPAGLATIRHIALEAGYRTAPEGGFVGHAAIAWRLRQFDLGFGFQNRDFGELPGAPERAFDRLSVGSLVYRFGLIAVGGSAKLARQQLGEATERGAAVDLGLAIAVFDIMALGFSVQNIGGNLQSASVLEMPRMTRLGFTMNYVDPLESFRLLSTVEMQWPDGEGNRLVLGGEGGIVVGQVGVVARLAYGSRSDPSPRPNVTLGATVELRWIDIDVAREENPITRLASNRIGGRMAF